MDSHSATIAPSTSSSSIMIISHNTVIRRAHRVEIIVIRILQLRLLFLRLLSFHLAMIICMFDGLLVIFIDIHSIVVVVVVSTRVI